MLIYPLPLPTPRFIAGALTPRQRFVGDTFDQPNGGGIIAALTALNQGQASGGTFDPQSGVTAPKVVQLRLSETTNGAISASPGMSTGEKVGIAVAGIGGVGLLIWALRK